MKLDQLSQRFRQEKSVVLDQNVLAEETVAFLQNFLTFERLVVETPLVSDDGVKLTALKLRRMKKATRIRTKPTLRAKKEEQKKELRPRRRERVLDPELITKKLRSTKPLVRKMTPKDVFLALVELKGERRRIRTVVEKPRISELGVAGTLKGTDWTVRARFWYADGGIQQLIVLGNLGPEWTASFNDVFEDSPGYADLKLSKPELLFSTARTMYREAEVKAGSSISCYLAPGPNLGAALTDATSLVLQGRFASPKPREESEDYQLPEKAKLKRKRQEGGPKSKKSKLVGPPEKTFDLASYPEWAGLKLPPVTVWLVRIVFQAGYDQKEELSLGQIAIGGKVTLGFTAVPLWTPLPHDRGVLLLATPDDFATKLDNLKGLIEFTGGDDWLKLFPDQELIGGEVWLTSLSVAYQLQQRVTTNISFTIRVDQPWKLTGGKKDVVMTPTFIHWSIAFPADKAKRVADVQTDGVLVADGKLQFEATADFGAKAIKGWIDEEQNVTLRAVAELPFVQGVDWGTVDEPDDFTEFRIVIVEGAYQVTAINPNAPSPRKRMVQVKF